MAAPVVYRSSDVGAPVLYGQAGDLVALLDQCLVTGYGGVRATGTITSSGTTVANNDTITIDGTTYTWKTTLTPAANEVLIGANAAANLSNLAAAISGWGVANTNYGSGTTLKGTVQVSGLTSTVLTLTAYYGGTGGNSIAMSKSAAQITLSGATLSGGSGSVTKASVGWTKAYSGVCQADFRQAAGNQFYVSVNDTALGSELAKNARVRGYETMSALATGTGLFPTAAQMTNGGFVRKSSTFDATARVWTLFADDRTVYLFVQTGDAASTYVSFGFGDIYSLTSGDGYRTGIFARTIQSGSVSATTCPLTDTHLGVTPFTECGGHYMARSHQGTGTSAPCTKTCDHMNMPNTGGGVSTGKGLAAFPQPFGKFLLNRLYIQENVAGNVRRGYMRGLWSPGHPTGTLVDGNTFNGTGALAGRQFMVVGICAQTGLLAVETTQWDTSS